MDEELAMAAAAAASSECSSGCQSGWTTYLDDHSYSYSYSHSCGTGTARFGHGNKPQPYHHYHADYSAEEDDLSMISDASSGPRHQSSAGNDAEARGARREEPAAARRRSSKKAAAAAAASLLEDTASSPAAFFGYSKAAVAAHGGAPTPNLQAVGLGELANGYADAEMMTEIGNAADFSSYAFSTTTGFKDPLSVVSGTGWGGGYMQMQYSPAPVNPMATRQARRDASSEKKRW